MLDENISVKPDQSSSAESDGVVDQVDFVDRMAPIATTVTDNATEATQKNEIHLNAIAIASSHSTTEDTTSTMSTPTTATAGILSNSNTGQAGASIGTDLERRYRPQKYCAVCGDKAIACNFNAVTCESCKAFFRRNAFKEHRLKCLFDNRCIIDRVTRRFCSKCRLLKCFQIGMKREWILTEEQKLVKRKKIMQNKQSRREGLEKAKSICSNSTGFEGSNNNASTNSPSSSSDDSSGRPASCQAAGHNLKLGAMNAGEPLSQETEKLRKGRQLKQSGRSRVVATRDAATNCPAESELTDQNHLVHYCSLATQCQYCSLRVVGCAPPPAQPAPSSTLPQLPGQQLLDYTGHQTQIPLANPYVPQTNGAHLAAPAQMVTLSGAGYLATDVQSYYYQ